MDNVYLKEALLALLRNDIKLVPTRKSKSRAHRRRKNKSLVLE